MEKILTFKSLLFEKIKNHPFLTLFFAFFFIYFTFGLYISFFNDDLVKNLYDMIFGMDTGARYGSLLGKYPLNPEGHPFSMIMLFDFHSLFKFSNSIKANILMIFAAMGASSVCLMYNFLSKVIKEKSKTVLLTLVFGFSFSCLIFSSVFESFIFSGLLTVLFLNYIYLIFQKKEITPFSALILAILVNFLFGMQLINIVASLIFVIYIYIYIYGHKAKRVSVI